MEADVIEDIEQRDEAAFQGRKRRWYHRRDVHFLIVVGLAVLAYNAYGYLTAPSRITPGLEMALAKEMNDRLNIRVTTPFPPEAFHMGIYQDMGIIRGTEGDTTTIFRVKPEDVRKLARYYWVDKISLADPMQ